MSTAEKRVNLLAVDPELRRSLAAVLQTYGFSVEEHASERALVAGWTGMIAGCVLLDLSDRSEGLVERLREGGCRWPVVITAADPLSERAIRAASAGAHALLPRPCDPVLLAEALSKACPSGTSPPELQALSPREREIVDLIARGETSKAIARQLGISPRTVEAHRARIMTKTGARNAADLAAMSRGRV